MDPKELRGLLEAYTEVYQELDEAMMNGPRKDKMIAKQHSPYASSRDRATAFNVGVRDDRPRDKKSTGGKGERYSDFGDRGAGNAARRKQGLQPLRGDTRKEQVDLYDIILSHLLDEGYAETLEAAEVMMVNMSEGWRQSIVEGRDVERGEEDDNPDVKAHNKSLGYKKGKAGYAKRPNPANDPRYGSQY
jgi:hypothetical protein